jgi:hypothetical protein
MNSGVAQPTCPREVILWCLNACGCRELSHVMRPAATRVQGHRGERPSSSGSACSSAGLRMHVQLLAQRPERRPGLRLPIQPHRALAQLIRVIPWRWQQSLSSWSSRSNQSSKTPENRGNLTQPIPLDVFGGSVPCRACARERGAEPRRMISSSCAAPHYSSLGVGCRVVRRCSSPALSGTPILDPVGAENSVISCDLQILVSQATEPVSS